MEVPEEKEVQGRHLKTFLSGREQQQDKPNNTGFSRETLLHSRIYTSFTDPQIETWETRKLIFYAKLCVAFFSLCQNWKDTIYSLLIS
jgi:hypothetical protein